MSDNKVMFFVVNEEGIREDAQILAKYKLSNGNNYITYTYGEVNDNQMIKIYTTGIVEENGIYSYREIATTDEWNEIKEAMKDIARDPSEEFPEQYKCNMKLSGEEVSVRKPKKLLVSKKFADNLSVKYSEETPVINTLNEVNVETAVNTPADFILNQEPEQTKEEDPLNKTIEIPTFEELQARTKTIESVINSKPVEPAPTVTPVAPVVTPTVEPVAPVVQTPVVNEVPTEPVKEPSILDVELPPVQKDDYKEKFKLEVEPVLLDVYAKQQQQIEALEEELSKTKFNLFEKQKEALSLKKEKDELSAKGTALEEQLNGVQQKMDGILNVIQGNTVSTPKSQTVQNQFEDERI